jgi:uncharacterized protein with ParB-like and HNH nuclease domain
MHIGDIKLKSVNEIVREKTKFFIPAYQRGYRWGEVQVSELLSDILEFIPMLAQGKKFYCLQPVIVKKSGEQYIVIDGQQRLTTIFIILTYLKKERFEIKYETRLRSTEFLNSLSEEINDENVDFYHISHAYRYVKEWFIEQQQKEPTVADEFFITLGKYTSFIWYEIKGEESEIDVFTRINSGKIALTDAELVKALFLNRKNFEESTKGLRQIEISKEWDDIEQTLQNNEFWFFLSRNKDNPTRIELVLDLYASKEPSRVKGLYKTFSNFQKEIIPIWADAEKSIKKVYYSLRHWFDDRELFHLIGYLVSTNKLPLQEIFDLYRNSNKSEFKRKLYRLALEDVEIESIGELNYDGDKENIFRVLLLFNIATIINNEDGHIRFAYDRFNSETWTLEHVHAQQDKGLRQNEVIRNWLVDVSDQLSRVPKLSNEQEKEQLRSTLIESIHTVLGMQRINPDDLIFIDLQNKVYQFFGDEADVHTIDNLALLSGRVNSSLNNSIFPVKRQILIERDKNGDFVPICTKNVFLKYYSNKPTNNFFWTSDDRADYLKQIKATLNTFNGNV